MKTITGFTIGKLQSYHIETVFNGYRPVVVALWHGRRFIKRLERTQRPVPTAEERGASLLLAVVGVFALAMVTAFAGTVWLLVSN